MQDSATTPERESQFLTSGQVAEMFEVHPVTVYDWAEKGRIPGAFRTPGGQWRFVRVEVEKLLPPKDAA